MLILPRPQGGTSSGFDLADLSLSSLPSPLSLASSSSGQLSSAASGCEALAAARSEASTLSGDSEGGAASGAGSMVAIGIGPNNGTFAVVTPFGDAAGVAGAAGVVGSA